MRRFISYSMQTITILLILGIAYVGCGNDVDAFWDNARNLQGACEPTKDPNGCRLVYQCGDNEIEYKAVNEGRNCTHYLGGAATCQGGQCIRECESTSNCPCTCEASECESVSCNNGACGTAMPKNEGQPCTRQENAPGWCKEGNCVECKDVNTGCETTTHYCREGTCTPLQEIDTDCLNGLQCKSGYCLAGKCGCKISGECGNDSKLRCVNGKCASCSNNTKDDDELGVDCGPICDKWCNGTPCNSQTKAKCASGHCVDNVCCDKSSCNDCHDCNQLPFIGTCQQVPAGDNDHCPDDDNGLTKSGCNASGECKTEGGKGDDCVQDSDCLSNSCFFFICQ